MKNTHYRTGVLFFTLTALCGGAAWAHSGGAVETAVHDHGVHRHDAALGHVAQASQAMRTVEVTLEDEMRFTPRRIEVVSGETVRFVVHNKGRLVHEFNIGSQAEHLQHQQEMAKMMEAGALTPTGADADRQQQHNMRHEHANSVLVEPGQSGEFTWTFGAAGDYQFACNVPGHYQAGMVGELIVSDNGHNHHQ